MEMFVIKYRKAFLFASVFMLLCFFYEMYAGIEIINSGKTAQGTGTFVNAAVSLLVSASLFINVRRAGKTVKDENAAIEKNYQQ